MDANVGESDLGRGVYFARRDCAGLLRRLLIIVIDLLVIFLVGVLIQGVWDATNQEVASPIPGLVWMVFAYLYLTLLRSSRLRTMGYILTGVKIVNLKGNPPSFLWMSLRLFLWIFLPIMLVIDLLWFWGDGNRQMLRDKLVGTYVIRKGAVPVGEGPIRATTLFFLGYTVVFPEVRKPIAVV
jgi:uncharacterized RDD family membrane protein YckC